MPSNRIGRINEEIQRELADQLRHLKDPRVSQVGMVSITRVDTTNDLRYARVYVSTLDKSREQGFHLLRTGEEGRLGYARFIQQLEEALRSEEFGAHRMADTLCQQILIQVNRDFLRANTAPAETDSYHLDPKMEEILRYIAANLEGDLSVDALAARFYMSRYYLMHRFKEITGYTVHQYTVQKRLLRAGELIREGVPVMKAAEQAGFPEYSTFLRAFQNTFHTSPKNFR